MTSKPVQVTIGPVLLNGDLAIPEGALGMVVFAHGSGSSRLSPRNRFVAELLNSAGLGTLLFDLLTTAEEGDRRNVFDIPKLGTRLAEVTHWLKAEDGVGGLPIGYFGASTGAGAALVAASRRDSGVAAVVSRGGRPDLAMDRLPFVDTPTLLIVGGRDNVVEQLNRDAQQQLRCESRLVIIPGATHLFEEPGALEEVARLATDWFTAHFAGD